MEEARGQSNSWLAGRFVTFRDQRTDIWEGKGTSGESAHFLLSDEERHKQTEEGVGERGKDKRIEGQEGARRGIWKVSGNCYRERKTSCLLNLDFMVLIYKWSSICC